MIPRYINTEMAEIFYATAPFTYWLRVELAVCEVWQRRGLFDQKTLENIKKNATFDAQEILENEKKVHHDVIAFLMSVKKSVGETDGRYIHYGLTSSDVVDTALALQLRDGLQVIEKRLLTLITEVKEKAQLYQDQIMIGRTHGVHAEITTLGLKFAHFYAELMRQKERLTTTMKSIAVGKISGAVGSYSVLTPDFEEEVCRLLDLEVDPISTQVISRDRIGEMMSALALLAGTLDRLAQEIRLLQKTESREIEEPFMVGQKGSSAMPHKRNPVICERICGMARVIQANLQVSLRNMALWHERDISHSSNERIILPDTLILSEYMLERMCFVIKNLQIYPQAIKKTLNTTRGLIFSQHVMLNLVNKGIDKNEAYESLQKIAMKVWKDEKLDFQKELEKDEKISKILNRETLTKIFDSTNYTKNIGAIYRRLNLHK